MYFHAVFLKLPLFTHGCLPGVGGAVGNSVGKSVGNIAIEGFAVGNSVGNNVGNSDGDIARETSVECNVSLCRHRLPQDILV